MRVRLGGVDSVEGLLGESHRAVADALAHGDVPFDELVEIASLHRSTSTRPLAGTMCQLRPPLLDDSDAPDFAVEDIDARPSAARFDIAVDFIDCDDHLEIVVEHDRMAIDDVQGRQYAARVARVLDGVAIASDLAAIDVRSEHEQAHLAQVGHDANDGEPDDVDLVAALDGLATEDPLAVAIVENDRTVSRAELVARSRAFAAAFDAHGACESRPAGIALPRGVDAIAAMIGAWRVGAPYVTFDHSGPSERDRAVAERCDLAVVVSERDGWNTPVIDPSAVGADAADWQVDRTPSIAWILSTSGSSGEPKLVPGSMVGLVNRLRWGRRFMPVTGPAAHRAPLVFADHAAEIFEPLLAGQPLVIIDDETVRDPRRFATVIEQAGVTRLLVVPTLMRMLSVGLRSGEQLTSLQTVVTSGEPLPSDVAEEWLKLVPGARLINIYGSTEVSADATAGEVVAGESVTVGSPIDGVRVEVVSSSGPPSPPGCVGEIWVAGVGVMSGYLDRDTHDRLVERDLDGQIRTWYRTGDRGRFDADGRLTVLGRADRQLKVRGVRIDPMEIEVALRSLPDVTDAAVHVADDVLCAAVVGPSVSDFDPSSLRVALAGALPPTHIPTYLRVLDDLPRTSTGKLDRAALSSLGDAPMAPARPPTTPTERWLEERWRALVPGVHALSVDDDFFSIGGQSLSAVELFVQIEDEFRLDLPASTVFDAPTIESLARTIDAGVGDTEWANASDGGRALSRTRGFADGRVVHTRAGCHPAQAQKSPRARNEAGGAGDTGARSR